MFNTIKNALKSPEIRKKLLFTLLLLVIFRLGCFITVPMVNIKTLEDTMTQYSNGITGLINIVSQLLHILHHQSLYNY